jgi:hypothetical protein
MIGDFAGTLEGVPRGDGVLSERDREESVQVAGIISDLRTAGCTSQRG